MRVIKREQDSTSLRHPGLNAGLLSAGFRQEPPCQGAKPPRGFSDPSYHMLTDSETLSQGSLKVFHSFKIYCFSPWGLDGFWLQGLDELRDHATCTEGNNLVVSREAAQCMPRWRLRIGSTSNHRKIRAPDGRNPVDHSILGVGLRFQHLGRWLQSRTCRGKTRVPNLVPLPPNIACVGCDAMHNVTMSPRQTNNFQCENGDQCTPSRTRQDACMRPIRA